MQFVFRNDHDKHQPPYVYVLKGKGPARCKAKIWLHTLEPDKRGLQGFSLAEAREMLAFLEPLQSALLKDWTPEGMIFVVGQKGAQQKRPSVRAVLATRDGQGEILFRLDKMTVAGVEGVVSTANLLKAIDVVEARREEFLRDWQYARARRQTR